MLTYIQNSGTGQILYNRYSIMYHRPILGRKWDRFILFPLQIKAVGITLQWIFRPVTMRCPE